MPYKASMVDLDSPTEKFLRALQSNIHQNLQFFLNFEMFYGQLHHDSSLRNENLHYFYFRAKNAKKSQKFAIIRSL